MSKSVRVFLIIILAIFLIPILLSVTTVFYLFVASPVQISGQAMAPSYKDGQNWIINRMIYRFSQPKRGDVIVFVSPQQTNTQLIKRIVGLPGEDISIKSGVLYINGQPEAEPYDASDMKTHGGASLKDGASVTVPIGSYFVLGDNRPYSSDSREWGFISREGIVGKLWFRYR